MGEIMNTLDALIAAVTEDLIHFETEYLKYELRESTEIPPHELREKIESLRNELAKLTQE